MNDTQWTIRRLQTWSIPWLEKRGIETPRLDGDLLLAHTLGVNRLDLFLDPDRPVSPSELATFKDCMQRRAKREPVAYILGRRGFWKHDFLVTKDVLIPRPETECMVEWILKNHSKFKHSLTEKSLTILEIGVGSGALLCTLLLAIESAQGIGTDTSSQALNIAQKNAEKHNLLTRTSFLLGDLATPIPTDTKFQIIVSNPPYIAHEELQSLEPEITQWEPRQALDGGDDGLNILRRLPSEVSPFLDKGGLLALEIGHTQGAIVQGFLAEAGYSQITILNDFGNRPRIVTGIQDRG